MSNTLIPAGAIIKVDGEEIGRTIEDTVMIRQATAAMGTTESQVIKSVILANLGDAVGHGSVEAARKIAAQFTTSITSVPPTQPIRRAGRCGRNALCPCGSKRKFKDCCHESNRTFRPDYDEK